jgi:hypothetical protein
MKINCLIDNLISVVFTAHTVFVLLANFAFEYFKLLEFIVLFVRMAEV